MLQYDPTLRGLKLGFSPKSRRASAVTIWPDFKGIETLSGSTSIIWPSIKLQYDPTLRGLKPKCGTNFSHQTKLQYDPTLRGLKPIAAVSTLPTKPLFCYNMTRL